MAEINVQRKGGSPWLWILGLVAVGLVVWALVGALSDDEPDTAPMAAAAPVPDPNVAPTAPVLDRPPAEVVAFLSFADTPIGSPAGPAHAYAADGIRRLSRALSAVIDRNSVAGADVRNRLTAFREKADRLQADPEAGVHAEQVKDVFGEAADLMSAVQKDRWPDVGNLERQIAEVRTAAESVDAGRPLLDQTPAVETFFDRAAAALRSMSA